MTLPFDELNAIGEEILAKAVETDESGVRRMDAKKCCDIILDYLIYCYVMGVDNVNEMLSTSLVPQPQEMREVIYERIAGETFEERVTEYVRQWNEAERQTAEMEQRRETPTEPSPAPQIPSERPSEIPSETPRPTAPKPTTPSGENPTEPTFPFVPSGGEEPGSRLTPDLPEDILEKIKRVGRTEGHRIFSEAMFNAAKKAGARWKTWNCMMLPESRDTHIDLSGTTLRIDEVFVTLAGNSALYPGSFGAASEDVNCVCYLTFAF